MKKIFPFIDQINVAIFNFILVFIPSILMSSENLLQLNLMSLILGFCSTVSNALIYQPFLKSFNLDKKVSRALFIKINLKLFFYIIIPLSIFLFREYSYYSTSEILLILLLIIVINYYEFFKRINMIKNSWGTNILCGFVINISWILLIIVYKDYISAIVFFEMIIILMATIFLLVINNKFIESKYEATSFSMRNFNSFGIGLLGAGIAFWMISGGYLLVFKSLFTETQLNNLRLYHNFYSGFLIVFVVLDNYLLSGSGKKLVGKLNILLGISVLSIIFYSALVYVIIRVIYSRQELILILLFSMMYIIIATIRIMNSKHKIENKSKEVMLSQVIPVSLYVTFILFYSKITGIQPLISTLVWVICLLIGLIYLVKNTLKEKNRVVT
ncbi:hypothetical protein [Priestia megaterium]